MFVYTHKELIMHLIFLAILGAAAGVFSGLFGLGGAVIIIPALVFIFGFKQQSAQGTSLAMLLPPIDLLAVWRYWKSGFVDLKVAAILAAAFFVGAALGAHFAVGLNEGLMGRLFGGALILIGAVMIFTAK